MKFNTWTCVFLTIETVGGIPVDVAQYAPEGSSCVVPDVSDACIVCMFTADSLQLRYSAYGAFSLRGECQLFSQCIDDGNLSLKHLGCSDGKYAGLKISDFIITCTELKLMDPRQF